MGASLFTMAPPVTSPIMADAGWNSDEYERRYEMIMGAAMQPFPTRLSWLHGKRDEQKLAELDTAIQTVSTHFLTIKRNDWYKHDATPSLAGSNYSRGLHHACVQWARGELSYRYRRFQGWWTANGKTIGPPPSSESLLDGDKNSPIPTPVTSDDDETDSSSADDHLVAEAPEVTSSDLCVAHSRGVDNSASSHQEDGRADYPGQSSSTLHATSAIPAPEVENHITKASPTSVDWADLSIQIDAFTIGKDTLWILMEYLVPVDKPNPGWRDLSYQTFLKLLAYVNDDTELDKSQYSLIYMDGSRRHLIRNEHDYAIMLKLFLKSRLPSDDTIKLTIQHIPKEARHVKIEPFVINMDAFKSQAPPDQDTDFHNEQETAVAETLITSSADQVATGNSHRRINPARSATEPINSRGRMLANTPIPTLALPSDIVEQDTAHPVSRDRSNEPIRKRVPTAKRRALDEHSVVNTDKETPVPEKSAERQRGKVARLTPGLHKRELIS